MRRIPPCVPDSERDLVWDDSEAARKDEIAFNRAANELSRRFTRLLRIQREMDAEWRAWAEKQLAAVTEEVERDALIEKLDAERQADLQADAEIVDKYFEQLAALVKKRNDAWLANARKQLAIETAKINADTVAHERRVFGIRRRSRHIQLPN